MKKIIKKSLLIDSVFIEIIVTEIREIWRNTF